jgi:hypothetical protein
LETNIHPDYLSNGGLQLAVIHEEARHVFRGVRNRKSKFGHMFGGAADYEGLIADKGQPPVHLLFRLNTADPAVGSRLIDEGNAYRAVYTVQFARALYVLHVFQKKPKKGIATPPRDLDLIQKRLKVAAGDNDERYGSKKP